ncbi:MAG: hypothetical protein V7723_17205 [Sneathiella sp.]|uniref:hypothetical protein n=1 Tax=Sneathiella sp. TaxID=1964365 RepID=UPI0030038ADF
MPEETLQLKRRLRFRWWMLPIILIVGIWGGSWAWDYYKLFSGQTPMFDVAIKLQVGDEIIEIDRTIPCFEKSQGEPFQYIFKQRPFTYRERDLSTGAHLKDGRAVMSIIPKVCREIKDAMQAGEVGNVVPKDFLPMTALVDNFEDPQLMKVFGARSYYTRDDAEVKVLSYEIKPTEIGTLPSLEDEFGWFRGGYLAPRSDGGLYFESAKLACIPLEVFRGSWVGNANFDDIEEPIFAFDVPGEFKGPLKTPMPDPGMPFMGSFARNIPIVSEPYSEFISLDHVIPAIMIDGIYNYEPADKSILLLRRTNGERQKEEVADTGEKKTTIRRAKINVKGKELELIFKKVRNGRTFIKSTYIYFDPHGSGFCWLRIEDVRFPDTR